MSKQSPRSTNVTRVGSGREATNWPHTDKRQEVPVDGARCLYLIVQPVPSIAKSWAWRATSKATGKIAKVTLGSIGDHSYAAAITWAEERNRLRDLGHDEQAERDAKATATKAAEKREAQRQANTVQRFYDDHYAAAYLTKASQHETRRQLEVQLLPAIGTKPISDVTRADLKAIATKLMDSGAPVSANRFVNITKTFFKRAVMDFGDETGLEVSPAEYLGKVYREEHRNRKQPVLTRRELGYVLSAVDYAIKGGGTKAIYARAMKLIIATGVRRGEALNAPWAEFDLDEGSWSIPASRAKNGVAHFIPLAADTVAWLKQEARLTHVRRWRGEQDDKRNDAAIIADPLFRIAFPETTKPIGEFVFSFGGDLPLSTISRSMVALHDATQRLAKRDGFTIGSWSPHAIRRTFSTELSALTDNDLNPLVPPHVVEALLNHQSGAKASVAGVYNKYQYRKEKTAALVIWQRHLEQVAAEEAARAEAAKLKGVVDTIAARVAEVYPDRIAA